MSRILTLLCLALPLIFSGCASPEGPATRLLKANVLPLELNDSYQFRKILKSTLDPEFYQTKKADTKSEPVLFERSRLTWGAIDSIETAKRYGNYFTFYWRNATRSDVTLRLEYRQAGLGNFVMAQERYYPNTLGSHRSTFEVTGDDFLEAGLVTSWRVLLIVNGRIVSFKQSFMWK